MRTSWAMVALLGLPLLLPQSAVAERDGATSGPNDPAGALPPADGSGGGAGDRDAALACPGISRPAWAGGVQNEPANRPGVRSGRRVTFHVSPEGRDDWSGRFALPGPLGTDGPLASIEAARDAARAAGTPARIVVGGGDYYLKQAVAFDARDAGLVVVAACGETPVLHGGPLVGDWTRQADGHWTASLPLPPGQAVAGLFVNGRAEVEARFPNAPPDGDPRKGWLFAAKLPPGTDPWSGNTQFGFHPGDLPPLQDSTGLVAHIVGGFNPGSQWGSDTLPVESIDTGTGTIHTKGTGYFFTGEGSRFFLAGSADLLDAPGEWWFDAAAGRVDYIPDDPSFPRGKVTAGILPTFFRLEKADDMIVSGLHFRDGAPQGSGKYGTDTRGFGAIRLERSNRVELIDNVLENVGVGIHVAESADVLIAGNDIGPVAGNAIYVGTIYDSFGKSNGARILANHIHDIGEVYFESAGVWFQAADNVRVADNLIENAAQFGIAGGSLWGANDSVYNAVIEHNVVRHANQQTGDGGAIKMMGMQGDLLASSIRYNLVERTGHLMNRADGTFWPAGYENTSEWPSPVSWAIYTDGRASGVTIEGNVLIGNVTAIGINGGWNNVVTGNVVTEGSGAAFKVDDGTGRDWHPDWAKVNRIEDNTVAVAGDRGLVAFLYAPSHPDGYALMARNHYFGELNDRSFQMKPETMSSGEFGSLADFQKAGQDIGSVATPSGTARRTQ